MWKKTSISLYIGGYLCILLQSIHLRKDLQSQKVWSNMPKECDEWMLFLFIYYKLKLKKRISHPHESPRLNSACSTEPQWSRSGEQRCSGPRRAPPTALSTEKDEIVHSCQTGLCWVPVSRGSVASHARLNNMAPLTVSGKKKKASHTEPRGSIPAACFLQWHKRNDSFSPPGFR